MVVRSFKTIKVVTALLVFAASVGGFWLWLESSRRPHYHGQPLVRYLAAFARARMAVADSPPFGPEMSVPSGWTRPNLDALTGCGTNALPLMLRWLQAQDGILWRKLVLNLRKQHWVQLHLLTAAQKRAAAVTAFYIMHQRARPAVAALLPLLTNRVSARVAVYAFSWIYQYHVPQPADILPLTNALSCCPYAAIAALGEFGTNAVGAIPLLVRHLQDADPACRAMAAVALARIGAPAKLVVPGIVRSLRQADFPVRFYGPRGQSMGAHLGLWFRSPRLRGGRLVFVSREFQMSFWALDQFSDHAPQTVLAALPTLLTNVHAEIRYRAQWDRRRLRWILGGRKGQRPEPI